MIWAALLVLWGAGALNYKSIAVTTPRRVVTSSDVDAKFEEVDKPYVLIPVDSGAALGLCVLADVSLSSPTFRWRRSSYLIELLDDQSEPFGLVSRRLADASTAGGERCQFSFPVDLDLRGNLSPDFEVRCHQGRPSVDRVPFPRGSKRARLSTATSS